MDWDRWVLSRSRTKVRDEEEQPSRKPPRNKWLGKQNKGKGKLENQSIRRKTHDIPGHTHVTHTHTRNTHVTHTHTRNTHAQKHVTHTNVQMCRRNGNTGITPETGFSEDQSNKTNSHRYYT